MPKPMLHDGTNYQVLPKETLLKDLEPGDRFTTSGRTYVVFSKTLNPRGTKVLLDVRAVTEHYRDPRMGFQPTGRPLIWSSLVKTSAHRLIYRPDRWNPDDEPIWFEYVIHEAGYAEHNSDWWKK